MAAEAAFILIHGGGEHADAVTGIDAGNVFLRNANQGRWWKQPHLGRSMRAVAVHACSVTIVIQQSRFGSIVWTGRRWKRVANFGCCVLGEHIGVGSDSRNIGPSVVAGDAVHFILAAQQPGGSHAVMRRMARDAGITGHCRITAHQGAWGVTATADVACALIVQSASGLTLLLMVRVGSWHDRHSGPAPGAVFHQKIQAHQVGRLHMRVVAGAAFHISTNQSNRAG